MQPNPTPTRFARLRAVNPVWLIGILVLLTYGVRLAGELPAGSWRGTRIPLRIIADTVGYYSYLPALLIHRDVSMRTIFALIEQYGYPREPGEQPYSWTQLKNCSSTGRPLNPYNYGVALLELPCFLLAHAVSLASGFPADGFSFWYQVIVGFSDRLYTVGGLLLIWRLLIRAVSRGTAAAAIVCLYFGTNLWHYSAFAAGQSHPYSFFLCAVLLTLTPRWLKDPSWKNTVLLGLTATVLTLVRATNLMMLILVAGYGVASFGDACRRLSFFAAQVPKLVAVTLLAGLMFIPQFAYWHAVTGKWLINPYLEIAPYIADTPSGNGFDFTHPHLLSVLFSVRKGVFFWAPILLFSVFGLFRLPPALRAWLLPLVVFQLLNLYLVASWRWWSYGASFGHRAFIDSYPLFAIGLAAFFGSLHRRPARIIVALAVLLLLFLNIFQTLQADRQIIHCDLMNWEVYQLIFLRLDLPSIYAI